MAERVEIVELPTSPPPPERSQSENRFPTSSSPPRSSGIATSPPLNEGIVELPGESLVHPTTSVGQSSSGETVGEFLSGKFTNPNNDLVNQIFLRHQQEQQKLLLSSLGQPVQQSSQSKSQVSSSSRTTTTTRKIIRSISSSSSTTTSRQLQSQQQVSSSCSSLLCSDSTDGGKKTVKFFGQEESSSQLQHSLASMSSPCLPIGMANVTEEEEGASEENFMLAGVERDESVLASETFLAGISSADSGSTNTDDENDAQRKMRVMAESLTKLSSSVASLAHQESIKEAMKVSASTACNLQTAEGANVATSNSASLYATHQRRRLMTSRQQKQHQSMIVLSRTTKQSRSYKFFRLIDIFITISISMILVVAKMKF